MGRLITARSPAAFAEEYILESIWDGKFASGTALPAERELAEQIGVTRATLREVLQRLARDGWLSIQHGKPTLINNIWDKAGLHLLEVILRLDNFENLKLVEHIFQVKNQFSELCVLLAISKNRQKTLKLLRLSIRLEETSQAYSNYELMFHQQMALFSGNPVYQLIFNGFEKVLRQIGLLFYQRQEARELAKKYYADLLQTIKANKFDEVKSLVADYSQDHLLLLAEKPLNIPIAESVKYEKS